MRNLKTPPMIPNNAVDEAREHRADNDLARDRVLEPNRRRLVDAIEQVEDDEARVALRELAHIVTGDDRFERG